MTNSYRKDKRTMGKTWKDKEAWSRKNGKRRESSRIATGGPRRQDDYSYDAPQDREPERDYEADDNHSK